MYNSDLYALYEELNVHSVIRVNRIQLYWPHAANGTVEYQEYAVWFSSGGG